MEYTSEDLNILDEMIQDTAKVKLTETYDKKQVILKEEKANYEVQIIGIPDNTIVIKADIFEPPKAIFQNTKGECKRADFIIISDEDCKKFILFYEYRFIGLRKLNTRKQRPRYQCDFNLHDRPEKMLKISSQNTLNFNRLIGKLS